jgi:hypothetical protein
MKYEYHHLQGSSVFEAETDVKIFPKAATGNIERAYLIILQ